MKPNIDVFLIVDHSSSTQPIIGNINTAISNMVGRLRTSPYLSGVNVYLTFIQFNHRYEILTQCELIDNIEIDGSNIEGSPAIFDDMLVIGTRGARIHGVKIQ